MPPDKPSNSLPRTMFSTTLGRSKEAALLRDALYSERISERIIVLHGPGGIGKSTIVTWFFDAKSAKDEDLHTLRIKHSFYRQGDVHGSATFELFVDHTLQHITGASSVRASVFTRIDLLLKSVSHLLAQKTYKRVVFILDGTEGMQTALGEPKDMGFLYFLGMAPKYLPQHQYLVIITSRQMIETGSLSISRNILNRQIYPLSPDEERSLYEAAYSFTPTPPLFPLVKHPPVCSFLLKQYMNRLPLAILLAARLARLVEIPSVAVKDFGEPADSTTIVHEILGILYSKANDEHPDIALITHLLELVSVFDHRTDPQALEVLLLGDSRISGVSFQTAALAHRAIALCRECCLLYAPASADEDEFDLSTHPIIRDFFRARLRDSSNNSNPKYQLILNTVAETLRNNVENATTQHPAYKLLEAVRFYCRAGRYKTAFSIIPRPEEKSSFSPFVEAIYYEATAAMSYFLKGHQWDNEFCTTEINSESLSISEKNKLFILAGYCFKQVSYSDRLVNICFRRALEFSGDNEGEFVGLALGRYGCWMYGVATEDPLIEEDLKWLDRYAIDSSDSSGIPDGSVGELVSLMRDRARLATYHYEGKIRGALHLLQTAERVRPEDNPLMSECLDDPDLMLTITTALIYQSAGLMEKAAFFLERSKRDAQTTIHPVSAALTYLFLSWSAELQGNISGAAFYGEKALECSEKRDLRMWNVASQLTLLRSTSKSDASSTKEVFKYWRLEWIQNHQATLFIDQWMYLECRTLFAHGHTEEAYERLLELCEFYKGRDQRWQMRKSASLLLKLKLELLLRKMEYVQTFQELCGYCLRSGALHDFSEAVQLVSTVLAAERRLAFIDNELERLGCVEADDAEPLFLEAIQSARVNLNLLRKTLIEEIAKDEDAIKKALGELAPPAHLDEQVCQLEAESASRGFVEALFTAFAAACVTLTSSYILYHQVPGLIWYTAILAAVFAVLAIAIASTSEGRKWHRHANTSRNIKRQWLYSSWVALVDTEKAEERFGELRSVKHDWSADLMGSWFTFRHLGLMRKKGAQETGELLRDSQRSFAAIWEAAETKWYEAVRRLEGQDLLARVRIYHDLRVKPLEIEIEGFEKMYKMRHSKSQLWKGLWLTLLGACSVAIGLTTILVANQKMEMDPHWLPVLLEIQSFLLVISATTIALAERRGYGERAASLESAKNFLSRTVSPRISELLSGAKSHVYKNGMRPNSGSDLISIDNAFRNMCEKEGISETRFRHIVEMLEGYMLRLDIPESHKVEYQNIMKGD